MRFIDRESELRALEQRWARGGSELFIIYGKRRVGKTELVKQFIKGKPSVYFLADKRTSREQLRELGALLGGHFNDALLSKNGFNAWLDVFIYLKGKTDRPFVLAIDEYPYLVETDRSAGSVFQKGWDEYLKDSKVFLILAGSSVAMMESEALAYKSPLYGRRTGQLLLKPMSHENSRKFFPKKNFSEFLAFYTILGGMPAYLLQFEERSSLKENIAEKILATTSFLHNEVEFILKEELREPRNYLSILKAISFGKRKFGEMVNEAGLEKNVMNKYLSTLEQLQLIEKEVPVTEKNPLKSRKGLYRITDNFVRFWFQYVFPFKSDLEIGRLEAVFKKFKDSFVHLEALVYEQVAREIIRDYEDRIFPFDRVGRWWEKETEIDVVALNSETKKILFGECKWSTKPVGTNIYEELRTKAKLVDWNRGSREEHYMLFSKSGFTPDMRKLAKEEMVFLVDGGRMIGPRAPGSV